MEFEFGDNDFTMEELEKLLSEDDEQTPPAAEETEVHKEQQAPAEDNKSKEEDIARTKAFSKRLSEATAKERDKVAKEAGYDSYEDMKAKRQKNLLEEEGLDPERISPIVDKLVQQKLAEDPRMQELEKYREQQVKEYGKQQLKELSELTNGEISKFEQIPADVMEEWKKTGSLKSAYLKLKGEELILKARSEQSKGNTNHLSGPQGGEPTPSNKRHLTDEEKKVWKFFNPNMTDEDLNNKLIDKN